MKSIKQIGGEAQESVQKVLKSHPEMFFPVIEAAFGTVSDPKDDQAMSAMIREVTKLTTLVTANHAVEIHEDTVEGLEEDLMQAVQVAYNRGAEEWALLNYPSWKERLEAGKKLYLEGKSA